MTSLLSNHFLPRIDSWLVVSNMFFGSISYMGCHPSQLANSYFSRCLKQSMDWFCWENLNRKPWFLPWNIRFSCQFSHHPIPWNHLSQMHWGEFLVEELLGQVGGEGQAWIFLNPVRKHDCWIGRIPFKYWIMSIGGVTPLINKPWFIDPGLTLIINSLYIHVYRLYIINYNYI